MSGEPGIQSMDAVSAGDWLVVNRGPLQQRKEAGVIKNYYPPEYEGLLVHVLAVSPPVMLVKFFPFPTLVARGPAITTAWHWDRQRFSRATDSYVDEYLRIGGWNRDGSRVRGGDKETTAPSRQRRKKKTDDVNTEIGHVE